MKIMFHGAGHEVGRSCIVIDDQFLIDAGIKITEHGNEYPTHFDPATIKAALISHAHLDHTGALPKMNHDGLTCPVYMTKMTHLTMKILLEDSLHIELLRHAHPGYGKKHIFNIIEHVRDTKYNAPRRITKDCTVTFLDAGHIPGSASILINYKNKNILYTGDVNSTTTQLLRGANYTSQLPKIDVMITEATYGDRGHPNREHTEVDFIETIQETLDGEGSVLIPAFAVGRAQEIILLLAKHKEIQCPIYLDGMSRKILDLYLQNPRFVKNPSALRAAKNRIQYISSRSQRKRILREKCIIITTSGMVSGGPVMDYLKMMFLDPANSILLTGYQAHATNGRLLLEEKCVYVDGKKLMWHGRIAKFDFSAHAGQQELIDAVRTIKPKQLIINHGDDIAIQTLMQKVQPYVKKIAVPFVGETITI